MYVKKSRFNADSSLKSCFIFFFTIGCNYFGVMFKLYKALLCKCLKESYMVSYLLNVYYDYN
jgi:hypothetical protein